MAILHKHYRWILVLLWGLGGSVGANAQGEPVLMNDVLRGAVSAFSGGDYGQAVRLFDRLERQFGREPEMSQPQTRKVILPARAYAEFATGHYQGAIRFFEEFLEEFPETGGTHAFCLYTLAQAYQMEEYPDKAATTLENFAATYPGTPESQLAVLQRADLLFRSGKKEDALALSDEFYESEASPTLRTQARLRALQILVDDREFEKAGELIRNTSWRVTAMPELAVLAFAALQVGDAAMRSEDYDTAQFCYNLVPPYPELLKRQRTQLELTERVLDYRKRTDKSAMATVWNQYYAQLVERLRSQLQSLEEMEDYMPSFLLRRGQAYLQRGRGHEAWIVFSVLAEDISMPDDIRQQAHYLWVLTAYSMNRWEDTLAINDSFAEAYPESDLIPNAIYLVAQVHLEERKFRKANELLTRLLEEHPEHDLVSRWLYTRGFNLAMLEDYEEAREDFTAFQNQYPNHPLGTQAALWHALTHQFEQNYETALEELRTLDKENGGHPLQPEIRYRIATAEYALRNYEQSLALIDAYLAEYPQHSRAPEATVLRGDILMGLGRLTEASVAFADVTPEAGGLFPYAVFQRGKIFKALELHDLMTRHFEGYLTRTDLPANARKSEALYWLGWAYIQRGEPLVALGHFDEAMKTYGSDPTATETQMILSALHNLRTSVLKLPEDEIPEHPVISAESFEDWLQEARDIALAERNLTWYSRLMYYEAMRARNQGEEGEVATLLMEIDEQTPLDQLDPEIIGAIGLLYADVPYKYAGDYFDYILENHPEHPARAEAWYGMARLAFEDGDPDSADSYLARFENSIPLHPLSAQVKILRGRILTQLGEYGEAEKRFEEVLQLREARGKAHAHALAGLAEMNTAQGNPARAISYWQRIYTVYRAYPERVAEAYYKSALLFEEIGRPGTAYRTLREMLSDKRLFTSDYTRKANEKMRALLDTHGAFPEDSEIGSAAPAINQPRDPS